MLVDLARKCGAVMLLQLKTVSVDLRAFFWFISVSPSCFTCLLVSSLDLQDKRMPPLNSFKASTPWPELQGQREYRWHAWVQTRTSLLRGFLLGQAHPSPADVSLRACRLPSVAGVWRGGRVTAA